MKRMIAMTTVLASLALALGGCGPSYSPDTYATNAVQQANKVDTGVIVGVRPVAISAQGTMGGVAGAAAGGVAGSQVGAGPTSAFAAIGGSLLGGIAGVTTEHMVGDTNGYEYIVRKTSGDLVSVAQKDEKPLAVSQKVLVIAGAQARIVPDYTVPFEAAPKSAPGAAAPPVPPPSPSVPPPAAAVSPPAAASAVVPEPVPVPEAFGAGDKPPPIAAVPHP